MVLYVIEEKTGKVRRARYNDYREIVYALINLVELGKVTTYGSIARLLGVSSRLIGRIMRDNEEPIIIPCHRVVKSNGELGGYSRGGAHVKKKLLVVEGVAFNGDRVAKSSIVELKELLDP